MSLTTPLSNSGGGTSFLSLSIKGGNLVQRFTKEQADSDPEIVARTYIHPKTGEEGTAYEKKHANLTGFITKTEFKELDFGDIFKITIENDGEKAVLDLATKDDNFFTDFLKKSPNLDFSKPITINPYDFRNENDKRVAGLSIVQDGQKIKNFYWDGKKSPKGYPVMEEKNPDSDDWNIFFIQQSKYLKKQFIENVQPKINIAQPPVTSQTVDTQGSAGDSDDLPF